MASPVPAYGSAPIWRALFWVSYLAWLGMEGWIITRDRRAASGDAGDRGSRRTLIIAFALGLIAAFLLAGRLWFGRIAAPAAMVMIVALVLIWAGMALRLWAVQTLGRFFRTSVMVLDDHRLIETGPYRRLRNPSYTGSVITLAGIGLAMGSWVSLGVLMACVLTGYARRIHVEDDALRQRFGPAYEAYRRGRWALIPPIW